jgi:hypothetical protein
MAGTPSEVAKLLIKGGMATSFIAEINDGLKPQAICHCAENGRPDCFGREYLRDPIGSNAPVRSIPIQARSRHQAQWVRDYSVKSGI